MINQTHTTTKISTLPTLSGLAAIIGGVLWLALTLALNGAWNRGNTFPTYEFLNGLRPLPLALFAVALYCLFQQFSTRIGRIGLWISLAGLALLAGGAALEFWIGGGVRDGDLDTLSVAGWSLYLIGYLVLSIGLVTLGIACLQTHAWGDLTILPLITGIVWAAWFPLLFADELLQHNVSNNAQLLFALLWIVIGVAVRVVKPNPIPADPIP